MEGNAVFTIFLISLVLIGIVVVAIALDKTVPVVSQNVSNFNNTIPTATQNKTYSIFTGNVILLAVGIATAFILMTFAILYVKSRGD